MPRLKTVAFDADDTLWQNEKFFRLTEDSFTELLREYSTYPDLKSVLLEIEGRNLRYYGFGIKGFVLSMIETAIEVTQGRVPVAVIRQIIELGKELQSHPMELMPDAMDVIESVSTGRKVLLITKGDLMDQERKVAQSGLGDIFDGVEIVSDKTVEAYRRIFDDYGDGAGSAAMVGNSVKSDIVPALAAGSWAVLVSHELTWELEHAETPVGHPRFRELSGLAELPELIDEIEGSCMDLHPGSTGPLHSKTWA